MDCDLDNDGFIDEACGGTDCDDSRSDINPDAEDDCGEVPEDRNCNGLIEC
ncbi:hypothetical protein DESC_940113 [Desulfosarcina cetonica]|nr:hypothetical protein DESC_940113 [Desulfosarcina cetonica]